MIKNRSFMLGLGSGLVTGALLLQLMISADISELTKEQLVKEAAKLDLRVIDLEERLLTEEEWAALQFQTGGEPGATNETDEATNNNIDPIPPVTPTDSEEPQAAVDPQAAVEPQAAADPQAAVEPQTVEDPQVAAVPSKPTSPDTISLRIPNGSTLTQVATLLSNAGVIQDKNLFLREAANRGATKVIQYGRYSFNKDESLASIIDKLVTVK